MERRSRGLSKRTIEFYSDELRYFCEFLDEMGIHKIDELNADIVRMYLLAFSERRNRGGVHAAYRAVKAMLNWWGLSVMGNFEIQFLM